MKWDVTASRTELITFQVEADSKDDAARRYLMDGEEIASRTTDLEEVEITEVRD